MDDLSKPILGLIADVSSKGQLNSLCQQLDFLEINYQNLNDDLGAAPSDEVLSEEAVRFLEDDNFVLALSVSGNSFQIKVNQRQNGPKAASVKNLDHLIIAEQEGIRIFDYCRSDDLSHLLEIALFLTSMEWLTDE